MARLLLEGANVLMLDEPTNDLDLMTLRVLEEALMSYDGAAVIVTHDRALLDRVCTAVLASEEDGHWQIYADRLQYLAAVGRREKAQKAQRANAGKAKKPAPAQKTEATQPLVKLSNRERSELNQLPKRIQTLETEQESLGEKLGDPALYRKDPDEVARLSTRLDAIPLELEQLFERWEALEARA
jgi:ATP-binding cassette subfamily F protein uup